jgi:hypothetical protein
MQGRTGDEITAITGLKPGKVRVRLQGLHLLVRKELAQIDSAQ